MFAKFARKEEGFTLIELLVVVAIIALLTAFAVPRLFDAINKSKGSRGQADIETISGALERYYMDKSTYPTAGTIETDLKGGYLKASTNYINGFNRKYLYMGGSGFYVLVDPKGLTSGASIVVSCNGKTANGTVSVVDKPAPGGAPGTLTNTTIGKDDVGKCTITTPVTPSSTPEDDPVVISN